MSSSKKLSGGGFGKWEMRVILRMAVERNAESYSGLEESVIFNSQDFDIAIYFGELSGATAQPDCLKVWNRRNCR